MPTPRKNDPALTDLGLHLKAARRAARFTQKRAGDCTGLAWYTVAEIEAGLRYVSQTELREFARVYEVPANHLAPHGLPKRPPFKSKLYLRCPCCGGIFPDFERFRRPHELHRLIATYTGGGHTGAGDGKGRGRGMSWLKEPAEPNELKMLERALRAALARVMAALGSSGKH